MKIINVVKLDKYNTDNYEQVAFGIYTNKNQGNYCLAFEIDEYSQYPLEDLLDQYHVNCTEQTQFDSNIIEVETLDTEKDSLIKILNFSTIVGNEILNVIDGKYEILCLKYGESDCTINNHEIKVPIFAKRNDQSGMKNFNVIYPEQQFVAKFSKKNIIELEDDIESIDYILLDNSIAKFVGKKDNEYISIDYLNFR